MLIRLGYDLVYRCEHPTPMLLMLNVHPDHRQHLVTPDTILTDPDLPVSHYVDGYGNFCARIVAPAGRTRIWSEATITDSGEPDEQAPGAAAMPVEALPDEALLFLLSSRYCETELLMQEAWERFGHLERGWAQVQAVCDFVHAHIVFGYEHACSNRTAQRGWSERIGVCRDFAHLAVTLCRCLNIPARYCTGYIPDIGVPPAGEMDFAAWFEAYLDGRWYVFDPRNNATMPRIGRIAIARGRDAADVAIATTFGNATLEGFRVINDEVAADAA